MLTIPPKQLQPTQQLPVVVKPPAPPRAGTSPVTIIPVPKLPTISRDRTSQIQPVVSSTRPSRTRFAKGTGPVLGTQIGVAPPPRIRAAEPNDWAPEDNDKTVPGLPPIAATIALPRLPSIKRLAR